MQEYVRSGAGHMEFLIRAGRRTARGLPAGSASATSLDTLIDYTEMTGRLVAASGRTVVSGGARGIDQAAMRGALGASGRVTGVLADSLERAAMQREHRNALLDDQLVLISPYDPSAGFNVGHAMQRNKLIYALADAALVVSSDLNAGGTWAGAIEQLEKLGRSNLRDREREVRRRVSAVSSG